MVRAPLSSPQASGGEPAGGGLFGDGPSEDSSLGSAPPRPATSLSLEYAYGYAAGRGRNNVVYTVVGEVAYPVGKVVVLATPGAAKATVVQR
jgi:hypothetical protein